TVSAGRRGGYPRRGWAGTRAAGGRWGDRRPLSPRPRRGYPARPLTSGSGARNQRGWQGTHEGCPYKSPTLPTSPRVETRGCTYETHLRGFRHGNHDTSSTESAYWMGRLSHGRHPRPQGSPEGDVPRHRLCDWLEPDTAPGSVGDRQDRYDWSACLAASPQPGERPHQLGAYQGRTVDGQLLDLALRVRG